MNALGAGDASARRLRVQSNKFRVEHCLGKGILNVRPLFPVCNMLEQGVVGIVAPSYKPLLGILMSTCAAFDVSLRCDAFETAVLLRRQSNV